MTFGNDVNKLKYPILQI